MDNTSPPPEPGPHIAPVSSPWHHRPVHTFVPNTAYLVTAGTLHKQHYFHGAERLHLLQQELFTAAEAYGWTLQAWAMFSNHYHFIAHAPAAATSLRRLLQRLHSATARVVNQLDHAPGRQVWFQFWDTCLTYEGSYYARLNYVHNNAVHHGLVPVAEQYAFRSAAWFAATAEPTFFRKVRSYKYDTVHIVDDF